MADLANLRELVDQAESLDAEIGLLSSKKEGLDQDVVTLTAKTVHLGEVVEKLVNDAESEKTKFTALKAELSQEIDTLDDKKQTLNRECTDLLGDVTAAKRMLESTKLLREEEAKRADAARQTYADELTSLDVQVANMNRKIATLDSEKEAVRSAINDAEEELIATQRKVETAKVGLTDAEGKLTKWVAKSEEEKLVLIEGQAIEQAKLDELAVLVKNTAAKNKEFLEYEERSKIALKAKEDQLIAREAKLREEIKEFKRRNRVLEEL